MKVTPRLGALAGSLAVGLGLALVPAVQAHAALAFVPCGDITALRNAIHAANSAGSGDIALASGCTYTVPNLDNDINGLPEITGAVRLASFGGSTVARSGASGTPDFRLFLVASGGHLTLDRVNVTGGRVIAVGGAVLNEGSLTVAQATVSNNTASSGGGVFNDVGATAELDSVTFSSNTAFDGGALYNAGQLRVTASTLQGNTASDDGGGLFSQSGQSTFTGSRVTGNSAGNLGGGIFVGGGQATLVYSSVTGNTPENCRPLGAVAGCVN